MILWDCLINSRKAVDINLFQNLLNECYNSFKQCLNEEPIASVATEEWLARCTFPIGMSDNGEFFPIEEEKVTL